jgi:hypothetical protein
MRRDANTERPRDAVEAVERFDRAVARAGEARAILSRPSEEESWRQVRGESGERDVRRPPSDGSARVVGIVVHRMLERWDGRDQARFMEQLGPIARSAAQEEGVDIERVDRESREIFDRFLGSELCARLRAVDILGTEMPVLERNEDGTVYRGTLDLLYRDRDNQYVVADYKTDREGDPAKLAARYGPQLAIYGRAVQSALGLLFPPRTELWHLRTAERIELESPRGAEP